MAAGLVGPGGRSRKRYLLDERGIELLVRLHGARPAEDVTTSEEDPQSVGAFIDDVAIRYGLVITTERILVRDLLHDGALRLLRVHFPSEKASRRNVEILDRRLDALRLVRRYSDASSVLWLFHEKPDDRRSASHGLKGLLIARNASSPRMTPVDRACEELRVVLAKLCAEDVGAQARTAAFAELLRQRVKADPRFATTAASAARELAARQVPAMPGLQPEMRAAEIHLIPSAAVSLWQLATRAPSNSLSTLSARASTRRR